MLASAREKRIERKDPEHVYYVDGSCFMYRSVTQLLGDYKPFDADDVLLQFYAKWQENPAHKPECYDKLGVEIKDMWDDKRKKGIAMHSAIQAGLEGKPLELNGDDIVLGQLQAYLPTLAGAPQRAEMKVFDEDLKIAGAVDFVRSEDGSITVYDWKRSLPDGRQPEDGSVLDVLQSKRGKWTLQLNFYARILRDKYGQSVSGMRVVCFHPELEAAEELIIQPFHVQIDEIIAEGSSLSTMLASWLTQLC
eukprot:3426420-Prymnesium_polylepis.2